MKLLLIPSSIERREPFIVACVSVDKPGVCLDGMKVEIHRLFF